MFDGPVLGIDPGLSRCGYGAVERAEDGLRAVALGALRTAPSDPLATRLAELEAQLEDLVEHLAPAVMAVERVLFQVNARTAMAVGQASGVALAVAARARVPVAHYSPNEVKVAVTGYGAADKPQVEAMVTRLLRLAAPPRPPDAADALALALCHLAGARLRGALQAGLAPDAGGAGRDAGDGYRHAVTAALTREGRR